jgi:hypothetical protein
MGRPLDGAETGRVTWHLGLIRRRWGVSGCRPAHGMGWQAKVGEFGCPDIVS